MRITRPLIISLFLGSIAFVGILQTYGLLEKHFTQIDDVGVAETLLIRNLDYRDRCDTNLNSWQGKAISLVVKSPEQTCQITTKLNRLTVIPSLWTYAPIQFWLTQGFLDRNRSYTYEEVKYWGRLPSFIFYLVGIFGFYLLLKRYFRELGTYPGLILGLSVFLSLSLELRIHAAQMHSYAIGIASNLLVLWGFMRLANLPSYTNASIVFSSALFASAIGMQYQAVIFVMAALISWSVMQLIVQKICRKTLIQMGLLIGSTSIATYLLVGNVFGFSERGTNWNAGPNGEFIVHGKGFVERFDSLARLLLKQTPENIYAISSAMELPNWVAIALGSILGVLVLLGLMQLWKNRAASNHSYFLLLVIIYGLGYFAAIFLGKLSYSPTRHFLYFLVPLVILVGYGLVWLRQYVSPTVVFLTFSCYCLYALAMFSSFADKRVDHISKGYFHQLLQKTKSSFLLFDGFDIEPIFSEAKYFDPIFWYASGGFNCAHKELLVPRSRTIQFITYSKVSPINVSMADTRKYLSEIIGHCTSHTSADKKILTITKIDQIADFQSGTSIEFSSRVLNSISLNNLFISLYQIETNFDSNLYKASLGEGIDFTKTSYPDFLKFVSGLAQAENWGRWSDANQGKHILFGFWEPLPTDFTLELEMVPFGKNVGLPTRIRVGGQEQVIKVDGQKTQFSLRFENVSNSNLIEIIPPNHNTAAPPRSNQDDPRDIGVGFKSLKIKSERPIK